MNEKQCRTLASGLIEEWRLDGPGRAPEIIEAFFRFARRASPAARDAGYVASLAQDLPEIRFFHRRIARHRSSSSADAEARRAVGAFRDLALRLNSRHDFRFSPEALSEIRSLYERGPVPGWPFFGIKLGGSSGLRLALYVNEPRSGMAEFLRLGLRLSGSAPAQLRAAGCRGALDAAGLSLAQTGRIDLKLYCKRLPTREDGDGPRRRAHIRWWRRLGRRTPIRFWTAAYRFGERGRLLGEVKSEAHFTRGLPPNILLPAGEAGAARWLPGALDRIESVGGKIYSLGADEGKLYIYFS